MRFSVRRVFDRALRSLNALYSEKSCLLKEAVCYRKTLAVGVGGQFFGGSLTTDLIVAIIAINTSATMEGEDAKRHASDARERCFPRILRCNALLAAFFCIREIVRHDRVLDLGTPLPQRKVLVIVLSLSKCFKECN